MNFFSITCLLSLCIFFNSPLLLLVNGNDEEMFYPNVQNCGMTDEIAGDARTYSPWIVSIYIRKNVRSKWEYFVTGAISGPTTVLSVFGGGYGYHLSSDRSRKYYIPPPNHYLVVAGLRSTRIWDADQFTQFANVSYVAPYTNHQGDKDYHVVAFRLQKPLEFKTPFVRPICIPFAIVPFLKSIAIEGGSLSDIVQFKEELTYLGGFNAPWKAKEPYPRYEVPTLNSLDQVCLNAFKYHYGSEPNEILCTRAEPRNGFEIANATCFTHGSLSVWKSGQFAIDFIPALGPPRFHAIGPVALIPRKDRGQCNANSTYFIVYYFDFADWIANHMICEPNTFPCSNEICIPLHQVCDGIPQCDDAADEDVIFCSATNRCKSPNKSFQCGFEGKCISTSQVGDKVKDCPGGNDEDERLLSNRVFNVRNKDVSTADVIEDKCFPIIPSEGVAIECYNSENSRTNCSQSLIDTEVILSCRKFYTPIQRTNFIKMRCYDDKTWKPYKSFSCQPECGLLGANTQELIVRGEFATDQIDFPWHAIIFLETDGVYKYICGASLVERNVLLSAAHCFHQPSGESYPKEKFRVVLHALSSDWNDNQDPRESQVFEIEELWWPWSFDPKTLQSDIAVVKLSKPATYNRYIRPVCYLSKSFQRFPPTESYGKVPGFGVTEEGEISERLKYVDLQVSPGSECVGQTYSTFCAHSSRNSEGVCFGDSGGGFVVQASGSSGYVIKGIVSNRVTPIGHGPCNGTKIVSSFIHVDSYSEWILNILESIDRNPDL